MSLPYVVRTRSRIPRLLRHDAVTLWPFIWYRHAEIPRGTLVHELTHAYQQLLIALAWLLGVGLVAGWSWWLLLAHPLPFLVLYGLSCVRGYSRSPFERHAEWCRARYVKRPVRRTAVATAPRERPPLVITDDDVEPHR